MSKTNNTFVTKMDPLASINPYAALKQEKGFKKLYKSLPAGSTRFLRYNGRRRTAAEDKEILCFEIITQNLEQQGFSKYSALSYTWGHAVRDDFVDDFSHSIECSGQAIPIGVNLHDALRHLFVDSSTSLAPELLWVDAISIDQSNVEERAQQVQMMVQIFARASAAIVWVGNDDSDARIASDFLQEYVPVLRKIVRKLVDKDASSAVPASAYNIYDDSGFHAEHGIRARPMEHWRTLITFLSRRWFQRIWVVQETIFPPSSIFCCGPLRFQWQDLDLFVALVFGAQWHGPNFHGMDKETADIATRFSMYREIRLVARAGEFSDPAGLLSVEDKAYHFAQYCLLHTISLKATDPRDKVYALSSFVHSYAAHLGIKTAWLQANYTTEVVEVFKLTLAILILKTHSFDLLSYVLDKSDRANSMLPTWCPHLHIENGTDTNNFLVLHGSHNFHAGYISQQAPIRGDALVNPNNWAIRTSGILVDKIEDVARYQEGDITGILKMCLDLPKEYINGEPPVEVLWRTLIAGRTDTTYPAPPQSESAFSAYIKALLIGGVIISSLEEDPEASQEILKTLQAIERKCPHPAIPSSGEFTALSESIIQDPTQFHAELQQLYARNTYRWFISPTPSGLKGKSLCRTSRGYLGLFPYSAEVGDEVWLLKGARVFHLLKKSSGDEGLREFLGESYVHGLMQGEALGLGLDWESVLIK